MKNARTISVFGTSAILGAGLLAGLLSTGCKSTPDFTAANAQALIQAHYDESPAAGANIPLNDLGMRQGAMAKYWDRTKVYPNKFWADFTLTPEGKKVVSLPGGGDVILWRPDSADDKNFSVMVVTVAANHLKAHDVKDPQDEVLPGGAAAKSAAFTESVVLDGVPAPLQDMAHNPNCRLSTKRQADFSIENGAWKLRSIN